MFVWIESVEAVRNIRGGWILRVALIWAYRSLLQLKSHVCISLGLCSSEQPPNFFLLVFQNVQWSSCQFWFLYQSPALGFFSYDHSTEVGYVRLSYSPGAVFIVPRTKYQTFPKRLCKTIYWYSDLFLYLSYVNKTGPMLISLFRTTHSSVKLSTSHHLIIPGSSSPCWAYLRQWLRTLE